MQFLLFFLHYFLHLLFGAFFIVGFFAITRGTEEIYPDGSKYRVGKIFKGWFFFWFRERKNKIRKYYRLEELKKLLIQIDNSSQLKLVITKQGNNYIDISGRVPESWKSEIEIRFGVKMDEKLIEPDGNSTLHFYKEYPNYVYPWWIRDALAGCITCHSSWLGTICFWLPFLLTDKEQVWGTIYGFTDHLVAGLVVTWIAYCISLAFVTTGLWKKYMA